MLAISCILAVASVPQVIPPMFVATPGGYAGFICQCQGGQNVQWFLNGTQLENLALRNVTTLGIRLSLNNVSLKLNTSRIGCTITQTDINSTNEGLLLIQGL